MSIIISLNAKADEQQGHMLTRSRHSGPHYVWLAQLLPFFRGQSGIAIDEQPMAGIRLISDFAFTAPDDIHIPCNDGQGAAIGNSFMNFQAHRQQTRVSYAARRCRSSTKDMWPIAQPLPQDGQHFGTGREIASEAQGNLDRQPSGSGKRAPVSCLEKISSLRQNPACIDKVGLHRQSCD